MDDNFKRAYCYYVDGDHSILYKIGKWYKISHDRESNYYYYFKDHDYDFVVLKVEFPKYFYTKQELRDKQINLILNG